MQRTSSVNRILWLLMSSVVACTGGSDTSAERPRSTTLAATSSGSWKALTFTRDGDVWLYRRTDREPTNLIGDAKSSFQHSARFIDKNNVAFLEDGRLFAMNIDTEDNQRRPYLPALAGLRAWAVTGAYVAGLNGPDPRRAEPLRLRIVQRGSSDLVASVDLSSARSRKRSDAFSPRDGESETTLLWSPSGTQVMVVNASASNSQDTSVWVISVTGKRILELTDAFQARWMSGEVIVYRRISSTQWFKVSLDDKRSYPIDIVRGRLNPTMTSIGLALDTSERWKPDTPRSGCTCTVVLWDGAEERDVQRSVVRPVWLEGSLVAALEVRPCQKLECGTDAPMWVSMGRSRVFSTDLTSEVGEILPIETIDMDVLRE